MKYQLPSRKWRILILSVALVASVGVFIDAEFGAMLTSQAKAEASAARLLADRTAWVGVLQAARAPLLKDDVKRDGRACTLLAMDVRYAERKALEKIVGAELTGPNVYKFCMKGYYGAESPCIGWVNVQERASIARFEDARAACSAK